MSNLLQPLLGILASISGLVFLIRRLRSQNTSLELVWRSHNAQESRVKKAEHMRASLETKSLDAINVLGVKFDKLANDLNLIEVTQSQQAYKKVKTALLGALVTSVGGVYIFRWLGVVGDSNLWFLVIGTLAGVAGFIFPDRKVRELAAKRRDAMRDALSTYLDLVKILIAGGSHTDGALFQAASIGGGWAFSKLKASIDWSRVNGQPTYVGLKRLACETGIREIEELASITSLADKEGASLSETLTRKAELLMVKTLADATAKSHSIAEKMSLPTVMIAMSFMAFIAYPALASITLAN